MAQRDALETPLGVAEAGPAAAPELSVVVTAYNEAANLEELYRRLSAVLEQGGWEYEVIVVDDGSTDGTFAQLERIHAWDPHLRAVRLKRNFGQHPAMHAGLSLSLIHI